MQDTATRDRTAKGLWTLARQAENRGDRGAVLAALGRCSVLAPRGSGLAMVASAAWHRVQAGGRI